MVLLPLFILPFFDQTVSQWPFMFFLAAGLVFTPIVFLQFYRRPAAPDKTTAGLWILLIIQLGLLIISSHSISIPASILELSLILAAASWYFWGTAWSTPATDWIWTGVVITGGLLSLISLTMVANLLAPPSGSVNLLVRSFGHNRLAGYLIFAIPAAIAGLQSPILDKQKLISILSLSVMLPVFLVSGGRAAMIGMMAGLWYLGKFAIVASPRWKSFINWSSAAVVGTLLVFLALPLVLRLGQVNLPLFRMEPLKSIQIMINRPLSADARRDYWQQTFRAAAEDPWGWGSGTFKFLSLHFRQPSENTSSFAHNQYLQMLAEAGILGGGLYLGLVVSGLYAAHHGAKKLADPLVTSLVAGALASALTAALDFDWQFPSIFLLFWLILGLAGKNQPSRKWNPIAAGLILSVGLYGILILVSNLGVGVLARRWEGVYMASHPLLQEKAFELARRRLPLAEFKLFLKRNLKFFQYDNNMMAKVLLWQQSYDTPDNQIKTAAAMIENNPHDQKLQQQYLSLTRRPTERK